MERNKMNRIMIWTLPALIGLMVVLFETGCGKGGSEQRMAAVQRDTLVFAAYTVPKEAYHEAVIPAFKRYWKEKTGREVTFSESYAASGSQSRAVASGLEADITALSLENDIHHLVESGLITHNWKERRFNGLVTRSVVVMVTRPGNPAGLKDWQDLTAENISVLYPSPKTSGGAMWVVNAIYGAGLKISEKNRGQQDPQTARLLLKNIQRRVKVMDKSGRASVTTFENGFGDVLLTYENEALLRQKQGKGFPFIIPAATILIENPIAVVDAYVDKHGSREVAEAFVAFVTSPEAQRYLANYGLRPVDDNILAEFQEKFPTPEMLFNVEFLGGWKKVTKDLYGPNGVWDTIVGELADENQ